MCLPATGNRLALGIERKTDLNIYSSPPKYVAWVNVFRYTVYDVLPKSIFTHVKGKSDRRTSPSALEINPSAAVRALAVGIRSRCWPAEHNRWKGFAGMATSTGTRYHDQEFAPPPPPRISPYFPAIAVQLYSSKLWKRISVFAPRYCISHIYSTVGLLCIELKRFRRRRQ